MFCDDYGDEGYRYDEKETSLTARFVARQKEFAYEIRRLGKQYFVQIQYRHFPIEGYSWLPFVAWLPRRLLIPILRLSNLFWVKKTSPDWNSLNKTDMRELFTGAEIIDEKPK